MNSATQTLDITEDAGRAVHGTVRPLVLPSAFSPGESDAYAQHVRNCEAVGVWPDTPDAWANRPWHRRQNGEAVRTAVAGTHQPLVGASDSED
jgi:hypothetical protein